MNANISTACGGAVPKVGEAHVDPQDIGVLFPAPFLQMGCNDGDLENFDFTDSPTWHKEKEKNCTLFTTISKQKPRIIRE